MAIQAQTETPHGLHIELYWRLNNFETIPNREPDGVTRIPASVRFRAFVSQEAFANGAHFIMERVVEFVPSWEKDVREEAYEALKNLDVSVEAAAVEEARDGHAAADEKFRIAKGLADRARLMLKEPPEKGENAALMQQLEQGVEKAEAEEAQAAAFLDITKANIIDAEAQHKAALRVRDAFAKGKKA